MGENDGMPELPEVQALVDFLHERTDLVEAKVADLIAEGATLDHRTRSDDLDDPEYFVVMHDPEGNEFCVS